MAVVGPCIVQFWISAVFKKNTPDLYCAKFDFFEGKFWVWILVNFGFMTAILTTLELFFSNTYLHYDYT